MKILTEQTLTGADAMQMRKERGLNQRDFWRAVACTQSCGCRYERGLQRIPKPVRMLLILRYVAGIEFDTSTASDSPAGSAALILPTQRHIGESMFLIGLARLGRDCELRFTPDQKAVTNLALAFNYGVKDGQGNRPTQWVDASLFGERAQKLAQYLTKGTLLSVHLSDVHVETYDKRDGGKGVKLVGRVHHLDFAGGGQQQNNGGQAQGQQGQRAANDYAQATGRSGNAQHQRRQEFDDSFDDSTIPF